MVTLSLSFSFLLMSHPYLLYYLQDVAASSIHDKFVLSYDIIMAVHEESDNGKSREKKGRQRRLRKKYHPGESDKEGSFEQHNIVDDKAKAEASESEDEESFFRSSLLKKKPAVKDSKIDGTEEKPQR